MRLTYNTGIIYLISKMRILPSEDLVLRLSERRAGLEPAPTRPFDHFDFFDGEADPGGHFYHRHVCCYTARVNLGGDSPEKSVTYVNSMSFY
jgi:hypothetical protein